MAAKWRYVMARLACTIALVVTVLAVGATAAIPAAPRNAPSVSAHGGFGQGFGVFHSYGWARGSAGYGAGACYWHPDICAGRMTSD